MTALPARRVATSSSLTRETYALGELPRSRRRGGRRFGVGRRHEALAAPRPPASLSDGGGERRDQARPDQERVDQDAHGHRERELAEGPERDDRQAREREGEGDSGDGDRPARARHRVRDGVAERRVARALPDPADDEDVVVRSERDEED